MNNVKVRVFSENTELVPRYAHVGDSGFDLKAKEQVYVPPGERVLVRTGLFFEVPEGFELQVRPRSGTALKQGLTVLNTPGTVDSNYRGEVGVILFNTSKVDIKVERGDRIAQGVICPVVNAYFHLVDDKEELSTTLRGEGGYGSTGQK